MILILCCPDFWGNRFVVSKESIPALYIALGVMDTARLFIFWMNNEVPFMIQYIFQKSGIF